LSNKEKGMSIEDKYALAPIPSELRRGWRETASIYMGMTAVIASCMAGGGLISGLTLIQSVASMFIGLSILVFLFFIPLGKIGAEQGLNTYVIGEIAFGEKGSNIATSLIVTAIPCIAWYGIQVSIAAFAIGEVFGFDTLGNSVLMVVFGLVFVIPSMYGMLQMAWLNFLSIPVMIFIVLLGAYKSIVAIGGTGNILAYEPVVNAGLLWGINLQIGMLAVGAAFVADYTRWNKNTWSDISKAGTVGIYPLTFALTIAGMVMALSATSLGVLEPWNIVAVMIAIGMPSIALILIFLLQWTTCITATYSSGLALTKVFGGKRNLWTLLSAVLGIALSLSGIVNHFLSFVITLAAWVSPVVGVIICEYYFVSKSKFNRKKGFYWPGIVSWLIGGIIGWKVQIFIPAVNALLISGLIYYVIHKIFIKEAIVDTSMSNSNK
jgi:cytosine permease